MPNPTIQLHVRDLNVHLGGRLILDDISFAVSSGQCLVVMGGTGSGKTTLLKAIAGLIHHKGTISWGNNPSGRPRIALINRQHQFTNLSNISSFYYQQRFNSFDAEDASTVEAELLQFGNAKEVRSNLEELGIAHCAASPMIQLSNGEHKRFQLAKALLQQAEVILLDNPYTGLDVSARKMLSALLDLLASKGLLIILVSGHHEIPSSTSSVLQLENGKLQHRFSREQYDVYSRTRKTSESVFDPELLKTIPEAYPYSTFNYAIRMKNVSISYGDKQVLKNINWEVKNGECWNLAGHNGSGKSTLLSLINGDNPQAFANEIYLFDKRKGTGESIWDIKRKIGYISPELHHYFDAASNVFDTVASGLYDTIGLFRQLPPAHRDITDKWLEFFNIRHLSARLFHTLSDGEQRLVLLARALVKNPPVLLLDEPCQGLDDHATARFIAMIDGICRQLKKTMVFVSHYSADLPACINKKLTLVEGKAQ